MITLKAQNAGRLISRGRGRHSTRTIDSWELIYVIGSRLGIFVEDRPLSVPAGSCLLLRPGVRHGGTEDYAPGLSFFWIHFLPRDEASASLLNPLPEVFPVLNPGRLSEFFQLFLSVQEENPPDQEVLDTIMNLILHEAAAHVIQRREVVFSDAVPPLLQAAERRIRLGYREDLTTSLLAKELKCSPDYLGRLFRNHYKMSITDAIHARRLAHAAGLLERSRMSVAEIAYEVGYNDVGYFRRRFLRTYALTPAEYRRLKSVGHVNTE